MAHYLVTGAAGFIGARVCEELLRQDHIVVGIDNLNPSYDVRLKQWRLRRLKGSQAFRFHELDICDQTGLVQLIESTSRFNGLLNLAARAGVRTLLLTHFYPSCQGNDLVTPCQKEFSGKIILAEDLMRLTVGS